MRPSWFTAASLTSTLPLRPPNLACQALEVYQHAGACPFYSYPFMRAENPTERLKQLAVILSQPAEESPAPAQPDQEPGQPAPDTIPPKPKVPQPPPRPRQQQQQQQQQQQRQQPAQWSQSPTCRCASTGSNVCAFTHHTRSVSIITTPDQISLFNAHPAFSNNPQFTSLSPPPSSSSTPPGPDDAGASSETDPFNRKPYKPTPLPGKGIGIVATAPIRAGTRLMAAPPAVLVDDAAWKGMGRGELGVLVAEGVNGLGEAGRERVLALSSSDKGDGGGGRGGGGGREMGIVAGNAFRVVVKGLGREGAGEREFHGVFTEVSRLNHACAPNLGYYFDSASLSLKVYAVRDIFPGEELTISYVDVMETQPARQRLLSSSWGFTCDCARCTAEPHLVAESNSRAEQMKQLRRELDDYSTAATPEKAELLMTLYELEGLHVRIYEAYYRAALEWNGVGDASRALRYARMCLDKGLLLRGEDRPFVESMREMVKDTKAHWSWRFRVKNRDHGAQE